MLPNGLIVTVEMALARGGSDRIRSDPSRSAALVLGMFREDVVLLRPLGRALPSPSLGHIWPRSRGYCQRLFDRAVQTGREGQALRGVFELGQAVHVLIDMACPAHAQAVAHYLKDPFERYVDAHAADLELLPIPELAAEIAHGTAGVLVDSLASSARQYPFPPRKHFWTRRRENGDRNVRDQAIHLIPLAAAHVRALVRRYEIQVDGAAAG